MQHKALIRCDGVTRGLSKVGKLSWRKHTGQHSEKN